MSSIDTAPSALKPLADLRQLDLTRQLHDRLMDIAILTDHYERQQAEAQNHHSAQIAALTAILDDAQKKRASHWRHLELERKNLKAQRRKIIALTQSLREEQERMAGLLTSTSWMITRPLRFLVLLFRKH